MFVQLVSKEIFITTHIDNRIRLSFYFFRLQINFSESFMENRFVVNANVDGNLDQCKVLFYEYTNFMLFFETFYSKLKETFL